MNSCVTWSRISTRPSSSPRSSPYSDGDISMNTQLAGLMKQAQQMQENMRKLQDELASVEVEGQSGAGMVKVTMTCRHDAARKVEAAVQEKMSALTGGLGLPPGMKLPF